MAFKVPSSVGPFTLNISDQDFSSFKQLLQLSKLGPLTWEGQQDDRRFGVTHKWLSEAKEYWLNGFDWRAQEKHINSFPNYTTQIEGLNVHFVGLFSENKDAVPLVFMHGWPGSFIEFLPLCDLLRKKYAANELPYHIIVPSLPGYTLSSGGPLDRDWTIQDSARVIDTLMKNLGFDRYIAQGGDVGSFIGSEMAVAYDSCVALHLNMIRTNEYPDESTLTSQEKEHVKRSLAWRQTASSYATEHATRPSTIGLVLSSSPLALLAWIGEKFLEWTDEDPFLDTILTNVSLYWFTQGFPRSIYPYRQVFGASGPVPYIEKPLGFSYFPREISAGIKSSVESQGNLVFYKKHEKGGHFAALERPNELLGDVEEFVKVAWK